MKIRGKRAMDSDDIFPQLHAWEVWLNLFLRRQDGSCFAHHLLWIGHGTSIPVDLARTRVTTERFEA